VFYIHTVLVYEPRNSLRNSSNTDLCVQRLIIKSTHTPQPEQPNHFVNDTTNSVYKQHLSTTQNPPMCLSNAPVVREFIANAEQQPATLIQFLVQQQPQPEGDVTMGNNDIWDDQTPSTVDTPDDDGFLGNIVNWDPAEDDDGFLGNIINWDPAEDDDGYLENLNFDPAEDDGFLDITDDDDEIERRLNVYRGLERPRNDEDWRMIFEYHSSGLSLITGQEYEFREWQDAWEEVEGDSDDDHDDDIDEMDWY